MKKILGLDLGTNSIGWALIEQDFENKKGSILGLGSRIIPMSQDILNKFGSGQSHSATADRTKARSTRKLYQRDHLRRERLHRVLNILNFLPEHYKHEIDFEFHKGQFINYAEPKIPYFKNQNGKYEFLFMNSFNEMVEEFKKAQPSLFYTKNNGKQTKIPYDWTIYYLRKKALTHKITPQELAWVILNFNQKRGYYQLSEEEITVDEDKTKEYIVLTVQEVVDSGEKIKTNGQTLYKVVFDNGWIYDKTITKPNDWLNKTKEFIVTTSTTKNGEIKRSYKAVNSEQDWIAIKKKTEQEISKSRKTVGEFIYESLLLKPDQKIRGKLVRTIERKFYKEELQKILQKQIEEHTALRDNILYQACVNELYPNNETHKKNIENRGFEYLFLNDIIFFLRPLKTKTHLISNCTLEHRIRKDNKEKVWLKCIAKSNPLFQEFRLWQFLSNLKIYVREQNGKYDVDITHEYLKTEEDWVVLYEWLNQKDKINQKQLLNYFKLKDTSYKWNYVEDKEYPCNETYASFLTRFKKLELDISLLTENFTYHLWHILYSVTDPEQRKKTLINWAIQNNFQENVADVFFKYPLFKKDYGSFSEKAIKKLLSLMRKGKYWKWDNIDLQTKNRIDKLLTGEVDEKIRDKVRDKAIHLQNKEDFKGLPVWLASYVVYDKHSESSDTKKWTTSQDIANFLNPSLKGAFKQHSLRNPIVEQVISETLRVVKDIWDEYGNGEEDFFNEIHIELGRDMKNPADKRKKMSEIITQNENTNIRIKEILKELQESGVEVKPYSPSHQEILKIYEEGVYFSEQKIEQLEIINKIRKSSSPSKTEIQRYKLWLEQGYISPYTGKIIMLSELFTNKYQIEHIFPQSRYFDDSLSNKVICESEVNQLKDNRTAYEFIKEFGGTTITLSGGKAIQIFTLSNYEQHIKTYFAKNKIKRDHLLAEDIPESFINRQLNDSRFISKVVKNLLSKIVRTNHEQEVTSKNIVTVTGSITAQMKNDWGLNDVWNDLITPRFQRLNALTNTNDFGDINIKTNKFLPVIPDTLSKGLHKKRIDHRHHALDALVIACVTKDHVNYITSLNTERKNYTLVSKLRKTKVIQKNDSFGKTIESRVAKNYHKPWQTFTEDAKTKLETTVVSFKQNTRVINKTKNKYWKWVIENGIKNKKLVPQVKGDNWAIRKPLHQATVFGKVKVQLIKEVSFKNGIKDWKNLTDKNLKNIISELFGKGYSEKDVLNYFKDKPYTIDNKNIEKLQVYFYDNEKSATRKLLDTTFNEKNIESITDKGIQKIVLNHLKSNRYQNQLNENGQIVKPEELAFTPQGIEDLNLNIQKLNHGKNHKPIYSVRVFEALGNKFNIGNNGNKKSKFVVAATGTNLFFAVYYNQNTHKREFKTIPLVEVIESLKLGLMPAPEINDTGSRLLFTLSPNDLVYVPTIDEIENPNLVNFKNLNKYQANRVYKMEKSTDIVCYFIRNNISSLIKQYDNKSKFGELSSQNKLETTMELNENVRIKDVCWKLVVDRLGKIKHVIK